MSHPDDEMHRLLLEIRDEIVRLRTLIGELRPVPLMPTAKPPFEMDRIGERQPVRLLGAVHQPWCHLAGPWHGVIPPSCTCGADPGSVLPGSPGWETTSGTAPSEQTM